MNTYTIAVPSRSVEVATGGVRREGAEKPAEAVEVHTVPTRIRVLTRADFTLVN